MSEHISKHMTPEFEIKIGWRLSEFRQECNGEFEITNFAITCVRTLECRLQILLPSSMEVSMNLGPPSDEVLTVGSMHIPGTPNRGH